MNRAQDDKDSAVIAETLNLDGLAARSVKALSFDGLAAARVQIESPFARLADAVSAMVVRPLVVPRFDLPTGLLEQLTKFQDTIRGLTEPFERALAPIQAVSVQLAPIGALSAQLVRYERTADALERAGWLPHDLIPVSLVEARLDDDPTVLSAAVEAHLEQNWPVIEKELERRYAGSGVDVEALNAMGEALRAHRAKLYRAACRTVFPEIERVAREQFYNGSEKGITSLPELREAILEVSVTELRPRGLWGVRVLKAINEACYVHVSKYKASTSNEAARLPNRHAMAHGYITYASVRDSLNALFIADFLFGALAALARPAE